MLLPFDQHSDGNSKKKNNGVFWINLKGCLTLTGDKTNRKNLPVQDTENNDSSNDRIQQEDKVGVKLFSPRQKPEAQKKGHWFKKAGSHPKLVGVKTITFNHLHPIKSDCVQQVECANKKIGNAYQKEIVIVEDLPGVPGNDKHGKSDDNRQQFDDCMKKQIALIHTDNEDQSEHYNPKREMIIFRKKTVYFQVQKAIDWREYKNFI